MAECFAFARGAAEHLGIGISPEITKEQVRLFCYGLSQGILGTSFGADLHYPPTAWSTAAPLLLRSLIAPLEACRRLVPGGTRLASHLGHRHIERLLQTKLFARPTTAQRPEPGQNQGERKS